MVVTLSLFLLSLLGIPPLVGFMAKFQIFYALWAAGIFYWRSGETGLGLTLLILLGVGGVNSVISAVYYLRVMKVMIIEGNADDLEGKAPTRLIEAGRQRLLRHGHGVDGGRPRLRVESRCRT